MPARDANRGRGGGRKRAGNKPGSAVGRQASAGASSTSSKSATRGGSSGTAGSRGSESAGGRASSRTTRNAQPSRTANDASASSGRPGSAGVSSARGGASGGASSGAPGAASGGARGPVPQSVNAASGAARSAAGVSSGIAGGDVASGGIATTTSAASTAPRASDIDAALFGGAATSGAPRTSDQQRDLEPVRESRPTPSAPASAPAGTQAGARATGRPQATRGLSSWLAGAENPLAMMRRMQEDLDTVFRAFGVPRLGAALVPPRDLEELLVRAPALSQTAQWSPQIEVFERDGDLVVHADLPGVRREDVEVSVGDDVLTIRGERRQENRETQGGYRRTERSYGTFFRQIPLPDGVDPTEIEAAYEDGVLEVIIPSPRDVQRARRRVDIR
jgi:HSP20 family protein